MVTCPRCGAHIDASAPVCPYCHMETQYGRQRAEQQAAYAHQAAQAEQARSAADRQSRQQALSKKAQHAMFWSLAGMVTCCFPLAIVGLVMGLNVKGTAKKDGIVAPGTSTAAVVFGGCALALFLVFLVIYVRDSRETDARIAALKTKIEAAPAGDTLDQPLACALVELELLEQGYAEKGGINIGGFQCDGRLERTAERAVLHDVRFRAGASERYAVAGCLVRGNRWSVKELREDGSCEPRAPAAATSASPR